MVKVKVIIKTTAVVNLDMIDMAKRPSVECDGYDVA